MRRAVEVEVMDGCIAAVREFERRRVMGEEGSIGIDAGVVVKSGGEGESKGVLFGRQVLACLFDGD